MPALLYDPGCKWGLRLLVLRRMRNVVGASVSGKLTDAPIAPCPGRSRERLPYRG